MPRMLQETKVFFTCKKIIPVIGHKSCRTPAGSWSRRSFPFYPVLVLTDNVTRTLWVDGTDNNYKSRHSTNSKRLNSHKAGNKYF